MFEALAQKMFDWSFRAAVNPDRDRRRHASFCRSWWGGNSPKEFPTRSSSHNDSHARMCQSVSRIIIQDAAAKQVVMVVVKCLVDIAGQGKIQHFPPRLTPSASLPSLSPRWPAFLAFGNCPLVRVPPPHTPETCVKRLLLWLPSTDCFMHGRFAFTHMSVSESGIQI